MSKGSTPRPYSVSQKEYADKFDAIFRKPSRKDIEDARNEQEAFDKIAEKMYTAQSEGDKKCK
jgi:predicted naringenin-chalcone synthase